MRRAGGREDVEGDELGSHAPLAAPAHAARRGDARAPDPHRPRCRAAGGVEADGAVAGGAEAVRKGGDRDGGVRGLHAVKMGADDRRPGGPPMWGS